VSEIGHVEPTIEGELAQRNRALRALNDLAARLLRMNTVLAVYEAALDGILAIVGSDRGAIALTDDVKRVFHVVASHGYTTGTLSMTEGLAYETPAAHNRAREMGEIVVIHPDAAGLLGQAVLVEQRVQTAVLLPLVRGEQVIGVLSYLLDEYREATPNERELLRTAATYVGAALDRAALYEEAEAERARLAYILEELPIGVFIAEGDTSGANFHWTLINRAGQQQFGATTATPGVVSEIFTVMHPDGTPYTEEELPLQYAVRTGQDVPEQEILFRFHNGDERWFLSTIRLLRDQGATRQAIALSQDITERKGLENQVRHHAAGLQAEHERLATLIDNVQIALAMTDAGGHFTLINDAWEQITGYSRAQVLGRRLEDFAGRALVARVGPVLKRVLTTGGYVVVREFFYQFDRQPQGRYIDLSLLPIRAADGTITGALGAIVDVTEKVHARQQLEAQRALFETMIAVAPVGIAVFDHEMRFVNFNGEYARMARTDLTTARGQRLYDLVPRTREREALHRRVLLGESIDLENVRFVHPDGEVRYYDFRYRPMYDAHGAISGLMSTITDVTEKVRGREEVEDQRALLETILEGSPIGLAFYDCDMRFLSCNAAWGRILGIDHTAVQGRRLYDIVPSAIERDAVHQRVLAGESIDLDNLLYAPADQDFVRYCDLHLRPVQDAEGEITGMLSAVVDVTGRHELDEQKDIFLALASHELKTPITTIKGYAQTGLRAVTKAGDERLIHNLRIINEQSDRLTRLINELLDVTRMQSGALTLVRGPLDYTELVREVANSMEIVALGMTFACLLPPDPVLLDGDHHRLEQVLVNLMQNAVKYSGSSRRVEITVTPGDAEVTTAVRDFGVGIPPEQQQHVFDRFFRASNVRDRQSGLGLGLFIASTIVTRHGGRMWLESTQGAGTTFYFTLPLPASD
jgi:PAS domain S-box-containing protein